MCRTWAGPRDGHSFWRAPGQCHHPRSLLVSHWQPGTAFFFSSLNWTSPYPSISREAHSHCIIHKIKQTRPASQSRRKFQLRSHRVFSVGTSLARSLASLRLNKLKTKKTQLIWHHLATDQIDRPTSCLNLSTAQMAPPSALFGVFYCHSPSLRACDAIQVKSIDSFAVGTFVSVLDKTVHELLGFFLSYFGKRQTPPPEWIGASVTRNHLWRRDAILHTRGWPQFFHLQPLVICPTESPQPGGRWNLRGRRPDIWDERASVCLSVCLSLWSRAELSFVCFGGRSAARLRDVSRAHRSPLESSSP